MTRVNYIRKPEVSSKDFHIIQNSKYAAIYYKPKNIFIPIQPNNLKILNGQDNKDQKYSLLNDLYKIIDEEPSIDVKDINFFLKNKIIESLEIIIQTDCNLNCRYCYAHGGHYGYGKKYLNPESATKYLTALFKNPITSVEKIRFFGGEPTAFPKTIQAVCDFFKKMKEDGRLTKLPQYGMVSNGTYYNKQLSKTIIDNNIAITFSIDGPKDINDQLRIFREGIGSYDLVINNIKKFKKDGLNNFAIEMTYTTEHLKNNISKEFLIEYIQKELGTKNILITNCRGSDIYSISEDINNQLELSDISATLRGLSKIKGYKNVNMTIYKYLNKLLSKNIFPFKCSAGLGGLSIFPDGKIYPCHAFVEEDNNYQIGNLEDNIKIKNIVELSNKSKLERKCNNCWCEYLCVGCPQIDLHHDNCEHMKNIYETIILLLTEFSENDEQWNRFIDNYNSLVKEIY